jgi:mannosyltransferase OCH1-like enzyme
MESLFEEENTSTFIPKRFIRVWPGQDAIPDLFERWWDAFQQLHPDYDFLTIREPDLIPPELMNIYQDCDTLAGRSDVLRYVAVCHHGGIYVDTDVMPLRPFDDLLVDPSPFAGKRSSISFESAVFGCPAQHPVIADLIKALPDWYWQHPGRAASVRTGPAFFSSVWFGRPDVRHLPASAFYPYNGFMAPKRNEKMRIFTARSFPPNMYCAHFSNHHWGSTRSRK